MKRTCTVTLVLAFAFATQIAAAQQPETPAAPSAPSAPATPVTPVTPATPAPPKVSTLPSPPGAPAVPGTPKLIGRPRLVLKDFDHDFDIDVDVDINIDEEFLNQTKAIKDQTRAMKEQAKAIAEHVKSQNLEVNVDKALREAERQMAEMSRQFPVPPVPPVPPKDPREKPRERRGRRIPEGWVDSTEPFTRTFTVTKGSMLMLSNISGNIQIVPGTADKIEVEALKRAWGPSVDQAKQRLGDAVIETYATGNRVEVRVESGERRDGRGIDVEFNVKVPGDAAVDLRTVSGDVHITNVKGELRIQNVSGNVQLEGTARVTSVKTVSGGVTLNNAGSDQQISLSTVNGNVQLQTLTAPGIDLDTINGDVRIAGWSGNRAHIRSLDGDLDLQTSLTKGGRYEIESHSGNIQLSLAEQPGFDLEAHTFNGRIRIDFPIKSEGPIRDSDRGPRSVRGTYGDASSSLRLQTFNGNLTVTRR